MGGRRISEREVGGASWRGRGGPLVTAVLVEPADDVADLLHVVTRPAANAVRLARDEGFDVTVEALPRRLIEAADEAFLTGTTTNIWPIERIDETCLPKPVPGPVSERLMARFERLLAGEDPRFSPKWLQKI